MDYEGPGVETKGQTASSFRMCSKTLPSYPDSIPVHERDTFWRWQKDDTNCDLMIASEITIMNSLYYAAAGKSFSVDAFDIEHCKKFSDQMRNILTQNLKFIEIT